MTLCKRTVSEVVRTVIVWLTCINSRSDKVLTRKIAQIVTRLISDSSIPARYWESGGKLMSTWRFHVIWTKIKFLSVISGSNTSIQRLKHICKFEADGFTWTPRSPILVTKSTASGGSTEVGGSGGDRSSDVIF